MDTLVTDLSVIGVAFLLVRFKTARDIAKGILLLFVVLFGLRGHDEF